MLFASILFYMANTNIQDVSFVDEMYTFAKERVAELLNPFPIIDILTKTILPPLLGYSK